MKLGTAENVLCAIITSWLISFQLGLFVCLSVCLKYKMWRDEVTLLAVVNPAVGYYNHVWTEVDWGTLRVSTANSMSHILSIFLSSCSQAVRLLGCGQLPGGLRLVRLQWLALQSREPTQRWVNALMAVLHWCRCCCNTWYSKARKRRLGVLWNGNSVGAKFVPKAHGNSRCVYSHRYCV